MNIYEHFVHGLKSYVPKFMRIMKLTLVLLITAFMQLSFAASAQKITLQETDAPLEQVFKKIRLQTGYNVIWNQALLKKARLVSVSIKDAELIQAMDKVLEGLGLSFVIKNKTIIVQEKDELMANQPLAIIMEIKGKVTDKEGLAIPGVTVKVKTSGKVAITDANGNYVIQAEAESVLVFSYIGFKAIEEPVNGRKSINIVMLEDSGRLDEVVVTALGIKRQVKALNYEVQTLKRDDLTTVQSANFTNSLNGKVAGVNISASASGVGGSTRVVMRGVKSISQSASNNVLYVVDGVPLFNKSNGEAALGVFGDISGTESIADFNPDDFESISVLTGPAGAALYGNAAANGAILITTRKGTKDGFKLNYSNSTTAMSPFVLPKFQTSYGNRVGEYESWGTKLVEPSTYDAKDFFNTGLQQINSLNTSIGNEKQQTFISFSSTNGKGIIPNNKYNRYNFTFRNSASFLNDKITTDFSASYVKQTDQNMASQGQYFNPLVPLYLYPRNDDFDGIKYYERYSVSNNFFVQNWPYGDQGLQMQNPYWITNRMLFQNARNRYMISGNATYNIAQGISLTARGRIDNTDGDVSRQFYASTAGNFSGPNGYYSWASQKMLQSYVDLIGTFNRKFNDFSVNVNAGSSYVRDKTTTDGLSGHLGMVPNLFSIRNINDFIPITTPFDNKATLGVFASAELGYKGYLYLSGTGRTDWSSRQANSTEQSFFYPSVGLSAVLSEMFSIPKTTVSYLKVRTNYSSVGLPLDALGITPGTQTSPINGLSVNKITTYPFPNFKAQRTKTFEVGANVKLFENKVAFDLTLYKSNTYDQLFLGDMSKASGYEKFYLQAGNISNKGIEASLSYNTKYRGVGYNTGITFTLNRNKVVEIVKNYVTPFDGSLFNLTELTIDGTLIREGGEVGDLYTRSFLKTDQNGKIFIDPDGNFSQVNGDYVKLGSVNPDYTLGWRHDFSHKNFNLGFMFFARVGGIVLSQTQGLLDQYGVSQRSAVDRDRGGIPINGALYPNVENYYRTVAKLEAYNTYSATNVRLQEVSLSYALPKKLLRDKVGVTLSLIGNNLWMIYNKAPFDPQLTGSTGSFGQGVDYFMMPSLRNLGFGVKVQL